MPSVSLTRANSLDILLFFQILGLLVLGPYLCWTGEIHLLLNELQKEGWPELLAPLVTCGLLGLVYTLFVLLTIATGGPIAVNISGSLKDVALTLVSFLAFDDLAPSKQVLAGLAVSFAGASYYIYDKASLNQKAKHE